MDKELLRVVIIAAGLFVIMGMLAWHFFKNRRSAQEMGFLDDPEIKSNISESLMLHPELDDFDITPKKSPRYDGGHQEAAALFDDADGMFDLSEDDDDDEIEPAPRFTAPDIIQFSVVAKAPEGFNGLDLFNAFQIVGLEYGSLKIFERLDTNRLVDFGVASMVEPGTFPTTGLEMFYSPGLVFFMQPGVLDDAVAVFDDFVETIKLLVIELDGEARDHLRQPLTDATIQMFRQSL